MSLLPVKRGILLERSDLICRRVRGSDLLSKPLLGVLIFARWQSMTQLSDQYA
jgi:hypothetical protein